MLARLPRARRGAFTLVELLLVLVILAVLAAIVIPKFAGRGQQAKEAAATTQISSLETALNAYEIDTGSYPRNLNALMDPPSGTDNWRGPYMSKGIPNDPWGNPYIYTFPGKNNPATFDIYSTGVDGHSNTINNWTTNASKH